jgi:hypothetical protein
MSREIKESDWKVFREIHRVALERFCQQILSEIERAASDSNRSSHERYRVVFELIQRRDREMANAFNDPRRSSALLQLASIQSLDLLTAEEMNRFSPETHEAVRFLLAE